MHDVNHVTLAVQRLGSLNHACVPWLDTRCDVGHEEDYQHVGHPKATQVT
jgi:hypothetical protein